MRYNKECLSSNSRAVNCNMSNAGWTRETNIIHNFEFGLDQNAHGSLSEIAIYKSELLK